MHKIQEITREAAMSASKALAKLTDVPVAVGVHQLKVLSVAELEPVLAPEELVVGIYLPVAGELAGGALLAIPKKDAFALSDLLAGRDSGTTRKLNELDISALKEVGNIVCGTYFSVLANKMKIRIIEQLPNYSYDMFGAITSQILAGLTQSVEKALFVEMEFIFSPILFRAHYLLFLNSSKLEELV